MNAPLQRVYRVSRPSGTTRLTGGDFDGSGAVTGALTTTRLPGDGTGWWQCRTQASPVEDLDLATCLAADGPVRDQLGELLTDLLAGAHTGGGARPRTLSGAQLAGEAERILANRDHEPFPIAVDGVRISGLRFNNSPVVADGAAMFLVVHQGHLAAIESYDGAGDPQALATDSDVAAVRTAR
ncbi:hypothetical protein O7627_20860 [Solwaraspora sp. WMMD1047]|uniref:hypothetical protein n=1 Tax=Solwaraspora sp. WMMD1047 TaxID=3016102 RepID=UPI002417C58E|nr:hypothetical protein [Solwaraspora sp. WMMD1047]MDG4831735.1 hypothetical protein [Solwaraspora sp. WMMD1047]